MNFRNFSTFQRGPYQVRIQKLVGWLSLIGGERIFLQSATLAWPIFLLRRPPKLSHPVEGILQRAHFSLEKSRPFNLIRLKLNNLGGIKGPWFIQMELSRNGYPKVSSTILFCNQPTLKQGVLMHTANKEWKQALIIVQFIISNKSEIIKQYLAFVAT